MREIAYAKLNLALHVRERRADGYHALETLFAFVDAGDVLTAAPGRRDELRIDGEFSPQLSELKDNILMKVLAGLPHGPGWAVSLDKRLPVAAGLGGGSADAGALFRMIEAAHGLPAGWTDLAASLGADVPACVRSQACIGLGTGTELAPIANELAGTPVLLVNPRVPLPTGPVFRGWDGIDRGPLPVGGMRAIALEGRNDLEPSAIALCPEVAAVLSALRSADPLLARMSGSGATCFALFGRHDVMREAAEKLAFEHPGWWQLQGRLR